MPKLAAFPKAYLDALCISRSMSLDEWIDVAATLEVAGLEFYSGFLDLADANGWRTYRRKVEDVGMCVPMLCCSPDFTHTDRKFRTKQVDQQKRWIDMAAELGGSFCRVLSGQRRPEVSRSDGLRFASECIRACHSHARDHGVTLVLENHYKDNYWEYPEFAQSMTDFCELVDSIDTCQYPCFGVNYDPSNALLAGDDPLELLRQIKGRVVTMHASDRYLNVGTIEDLRLESPGPGYASRLSHGEIGKGLNDYDAIFKELHGVGFDGWISIEDGIDGLDQLKRSVSFLKRKIDLYWRQEVSQSPAK